MGGTFERRLGCCGMAKNLLRLLIKEMDERKLVAGCQSLCLGAFLVRWSQRLRGASFHNAAAAASLFHAAHASHTWLVLHGALHGLEALIWLPYCA